MQRRRCIFLTSRGPLTSIDPSNTDGLSELGGQSPNCRVTRRNVACHGGPDKLPTPDIRDSGEVGIRAGPSFATLLRTKRGRGQVARQRNRRRRTRFLAGLALRVAGTAALSDEAEVVSEDLHAEPYGPV